MPSLIQDLETEIFQGHYLHTPDHGLTKNELEFRFWLKLADRSQHMLSCIVLKTTSHDVAKFLKITVVSFLTTLNVLSISTTAGETYLLLFINFFAMMTTSQKRKIPRLLPLVVLAGPLATITRSEFWCFDSQLFVLRMFWTNITANWFFSFSSFRLLKFSSSAAPRLAFNSLGHPWSCFGKTS